MITLYEYDVKEIRVKRGLQQQEIVEEALLIYTVSGGSTGTAAYADFGWIVEDKAIPDTFWSPASFDQLAEEQGVRPITETNKLAYWWPANENIDDFISAVMDWRKDS
ncbi:MAG: hypothetical protein FJ320_05185 [SAR202 cluster bacterium]|nr:hypothetical protein [SAR202 cluster bacterium]